MNCKNCGTMIIDKKFQVELWQDEHPEIIIGPYCESCMRKIRVCSKCHKPHEFDDGKLINGKFVCNGCSILEVL